MASKELPRFRLHLVCEFGQLPEQVEAEYTPLRLLARPLGIKRVFRAECAWRSQKRKEKKARAFELAPGWEASI